MLLRNKKKKRTRRIWRELHVRLFRSNRVNCNIRLSGRGIFPWGGGRTHFVACRRGLTFDHASLSRRTAVPTPRRDVYNISPLTTHVETSLPYTTTQEHYTCIFPSLLRRPW